MRYRQWFLVLGLAILWFPNHAANSQGAQILWTFDTGGEVWSSPVIENGVLYIGSDSGSLYALDSATSDVIWEFEVGDFVRSRPAIGEDTIYISSDLGYLHAINKADGTEIWRFDIGTAEIAKRRERHTWRTEYLYQQSSPVLKDGVVYVGGEREFVYAVDAATGEELWRFDVDVGFAGPVRNTPGVTDELVLVGGFMGDYYGLDLKTGEQVWYQRLDGNINTRSVVVDDKVYVGTRGFVLYAIDAAIGDIQWEVEYPSSWVESSPVVVNNTVYTGSSDANRVFAWNAQTGESLWEHRVYQYTWSSPAYADGVIYIGLISPDEGYLLALDAEDGSELWKLQMGDALAYVRSGVVSSPLVADGVLYFGSLDGNVYAMNIE